MGHLEIEFETMKPISDPTSSNQSSEAYRKIDLYSQTNGKKKLYLRILDPQSKVNTYNILAGYTTPYKRDELEDKILDNILVPAMFRCYATPDRNPAMATNPGKGWIYIIRTFKDRDGSDTTELWRELKSLGTGSYQDVNLIENLGTDENQILRKDTEHREATCQPAFRVLLPYKVNKDPQQLWIAYSEVQWSLARIQQMLDDVDLREKRMHSVDLSDADADFANSNCSLVFGKLGHTLDGVNPNDWKDVTGPAKFYTLDSAPDAASKNLPDAFKEAIPVVYLDDPVGIGRNLAKRYQNQCGLMLEAVKEQEQKAAEAIKNEDYSPVRWLESAKLFNSLLTARITAPQNGESENAEEQELRQKRYEKTQKSIADLKSDTNMAKLEQALIKTEREELRPNLIQFKQELVDFLNQELVTTEETPMQRALDDHFTLQATRNWKWYEAPQGDRPEPDVTWPNAYADGWKAVSDLIQLLDKHENDFDQDYIGDFDSWTMRRNDQGVALLIRLADPQTNLPLQQRLFPTTVGTNPAAVGAKQGELSSFDADKFSRQEGQDLHDSARIIARFFKPYEEIIALRDRKNANFEEQINRIKPHLTRLVNGITALNIEPVQADSDDIRSYYETAGKSFWPVEQKALILLGKTANAYFTDQISADEAGLQTTTVDQIVDTNGPGLTNIKAAPGSGYVLKEVQIRTTEASATADFTATAANGEKAPLTATTSGSKRPKTGSRRYRVSAFMSLDDAGRQRLFKRIGNNQQYIKAVTGLLGIVEVINVVNCLQSISSNPTKKKDWSTYAELLKNLSSLFTAVAETVEVAQQASVYGSKVDQRLAGIVARKSYTDLRFMGHLGNILDFGLTFKSLLDNTEQGDDAAKGDLLTLGAAILATPAGQAFIGRTIAAATGIALGSVALGAISLGITVAVAAICYYFLPNSSYLELWVKNGPFSRRDAPFLGHNPGSRVEQRTVYVQVAGTSKRVAQYQTVTGTALRYAIWCETPEEAYKALQDAIYRPLIQVKETLLNQISLLQIAVDFPLLLPFSKPIIQLERWESAYTEYTRNSSWQLNEVAQHAAVNETITYEKIDKNEATEIRKPLSEWTCKDNIYSLDLMNHHETKLTVRVRLDVNGDGSFVIPYETAFHDDVDTEKEQNKDEDNPAQRWLIHSDLYDKPRNQVHDGNKRVIYDEKYTDL